MLKTLAVAGYRSLRNLVAPLGRLNLITGANGVGKSSLYRALRLLAETAQGSVIPSLAREGGLPCTLWAGPETPAPSVMRGEHPVEGTRRKKVTSLQLGFASEEYSYAIDLGLPPPSSSAFALDPEIKRECIWHGERLRPSTTLVDRSGPLVRLFREETGWMVAAQNLASFDSVLGHFADPQNAPEILALRETVRSWRFYDYFRTDAESPVRLPQLGTHTPAVGNDGRDLAAALQTIREVGDNTALDTALEDAFPGSRISIESAGGRFSLGLWQQGLLRPLGASELSDGTLRYLLWVAALLTPRPPPLIILNEPETSLHLDLLPALGRLIARAAKFSQVVVVSHAAALQASLAEEADLQLIRLEKRFGETVIADRGYLPAAVWRWPSR